MAVRIFAEAKFPEQMLPVPPAFLPARRLPGDAGEMEQDSVGFGHGDAWLQQ